MPDAEPASSSPEPSSSPEREDDQAPGDARPFDVESERVPAWVHASSAAVVFVGILVALHLVPMFAVLPFLVTSSLGGRFGSSAMHVVVEGQRLRLGDRVVTSAALRDVWLAGDDAEPRVVLALGGAGSELVHLRFETREHAERFADACHALVAEKPVLVAGYLPRPVDLLPSLRFVSIALAFFATGSWYGGFALAFFALGARLLFRAKQIVVDDRGFLVRAAYRTERRYAFDEVASVDLDAGVVTLRDGSELVISASSIKGPLLSSPSWLDASRLRVLRRISEGRHELRRL